MANTQQRGFIDEVQTWFATLPPVTRFLFAGTFGFSLAAGLHIVMPMQLVFVPKLIFSKFQLWRLVTAFLWQPLGLNLLMHLYFLYRNSYDLETGLFVGRTADYVFFMIFCTGTISLAASYLKLFVLAEPLLLAIIYVWSMHNRETPVSFLFGIRFKALYLPWALVGLDVIQGVPFPIPKLLGIAVGYLYYYLDQTYPAQNNGRKLLYTPQILYDYFPPQRGASGTSSAGFHYQPPAQPAGGRVGGDAGATGTATETTRRHTWGSGRRLGTD